MASFDINWDELKKQLAPAAQDLVIEWVKKNLPPEEWAQVRVKQTPGELNVNFVAPLEIKAKIEKLIAEQNAKD